MKISKKRQLKKILSKLLTKYLKMYCALGHNTELGKNSFFPVTVKTDVCTVYKQNLKLCLYTVQTWVCTAVLCAAVGLWKQKMRKRKNRTMAKKCNVCVAYFLPFQTQKRHKYTIINRKDKTKKNLIHIYHYFN